MDDPFTALYGQLSSIKKTMDAITLNKEIGKLSEKGKNGFQFTKQEIKYQTGDQSHA